MNADDRLREAIANAKHPEHVCHKCGGRNLKSWFVDSDLWNEHVRSGNQPGILCPQCFVELTEQNGIGTGDLGFITWKLIPERRYDGQISQLTRERLAAQEQIAALQSENERLRKEIGRAHV